MIREYVINRSIKQSLSDQREYQMLDPKKVQEKADILETNLFKSISKQKDPSLIRIRINRNHFPAQVSNKALLQLMPRFNIKPSFFVLGLRDLMNKELTADESATFYTELSDGENTLYADDKTISRGFEAILTKDELQITITGVTVVPSNDGRIAESFFDHEQSAGKLLKDGIINFKEINRYPIVNAGAKLFYITHEKQGSPGISFDGKFLPVEEAAPMMINIGPGVEKVMDIDKDSGRSNGYYLRAEKTGVVVLDRDNNGAIRSIEISDEMNIKRLDYSVGNIGTQYTCPIQAKIGIICNGFRIRVNGQVQADISEGGEITTNNEAHVVLVQTGSKIIAHKDINITAASGSVLLSEKGCVTIGNELIDSKVQAPEVFFEKTNGLLTNNLIETNKLSLKGLNFSGVNTIHFGNDLFSQKQDQIKALDAVGHKISELENNGKLLMGQLQIELKRMTKLTVMNPDLKTNIKTVILSMKTMDYQIIYKEMDTIQKQYNTKVVANTRKLFEALEKIPASTGVYIQKKESIDRDIQEIDHKMELMRVEFEGTLRKGATIKLFCGSLEEKDVSKPDFLLESEGDKTKYIKVTGTYSHHKGFEFVQ